MRADSWTGRLLLTIARRTPAYQAVGPRGISRFSRFPDVTGRSPDRAVGEDRWFVREVAREVVKMVAPRESPSFSAVSTAYFAKPQWVLSGAHAGSGRSPLTSKASKTDRWTPVVLAAVTQVGRYLAGEIRNAGAGAEGSAAPGDLRRFLHADDEPGRGPVLRLNDTQRAAVHRIVSETVRASGLPDDAVRRITAALAGDDETGGRR
jgi:hypothetical protein